MYMYTEIMSRTSVECFFLTWQVLPELSLPPDVDVIWVDKDVAAASEDQGI